MAGKFPPGSLAANNRAAHDLTMNLRGILGWFDSIRAIDRDKPPQPLPEWWNEYAREADRLSPKRNPPSRRSRLVWARQTTLSEIDFVLSKWSPLTDPIQ